MVMNGGVLLVGHGAKLRQSPSPEDSFYQARGPVP